MLRASDPSPQHVPVQKQKETISASTEGALGEWATTSARCVISTTQQSIPKSPPDPQQDDVLLSGLQKEPPGRLGVRQVYRSRHEHADVKVSMRQESICNICSSASTPLPFHYIDINLGADSGKHKSTHLNFTQYILIIATLQVLLLLLKGGAGLNASTLLNRCLDLFLFVSNPTSEPDHQPLSAERKSTLLQLEDTPRTARGT